MILTVAQLALLGAIRHTHALAMHLQVLDFEAILALCKYFGVLLVLLRGFQDEVWSYLDNEQVSVLIFIPMLGGFPPTDHLVDGVVDEGLQAVTPDGDLSCGILIILEMAKLVGCS